MRTFHKSDVTTIVEALSMAWEYFDKRADCDCDQDGFIPNEEMKLFQMCEAALECFSREEAAREACIDHYEECKADWQRTGEDE